MSLKNSNTYISILIVIIIILFRIAFAESYGGGYSFDSGSFFLATEDYSIQDDRPHLPGYYWHVEAIKTLTSLTNSPRSAAVWLSIIYSALASLFIYLTLIKKYNIKESLLIVAVIATNPFISFFSSVSEVYAVDYFFAALIFYLGLNGKSRAYIPLAIAVLSGIRQSSGALFIPLYLYFFYLDYKIVKSSVKRHTFAIIVSVLIALTWLVPMINSAGGIDAYLSLYSTNSPVGTIQIVPAIIRFLSYFIWLSPTLALSLLFAFSSRRSESITVNKDFNNIYLKALLAWVVPILIFFLLGFYSKGYLMIIATGIIMLAILSIEGKRHLTLALTAAIIFNLIIFIFTPAYLPQLESLYSPKFRNDSKLKVAFDRVISSYSCSANNIRNIEHNYKNIEELFSKNFDSTSKYIFVDPSSPISVRNLQYLYPQKRFYIMLLSDTSTALQYYNYSQIKLNFRSVLDSSIIISRKDFFENNINNYFKNENISLGDITFYKTTSYDNKSLLKLYNSMFVK